MVICARRCNKVLILVEINTQYVTLMRMNLFHRLTISQVPNVDHLVGTTWSENAFVCWMPHTLVDHAIVLEWGLWSSLGRHTIPNLERLIHTARENRSFIQVIPFYALYLCLMTLEYCQRLWLTHLPQFHGLVTTSGQNLGLIALIETYIKTAVRRLKRLYFLQAFCRIQLKHFYSPCPNDSKILTWRHDHFVSFEWTKFDRNVAQLPGLNARYHFCIFIFDLI